MENNNEIRIINGIKALVVDESNTEKCADYGRRYIGSVDLESEFDGAIIIEANLGWVRFEQSLRVASYIFAKAGTGIEAGWGIEAGLYIRCKLTLTARFNVFAGTTICRKATGEDKEVRVGKLKAEVAYGDVVETGIDTQKNENIIAIIEEQLKELKNGLGVVEE